MADAENPDGVPAGGPGDVPEFDNSDLAPAIRRLDAARAADDPRAAAAAEPTCGN